jgi:hypothetical protein
LKVAGSTNGISFRAQFSHSNAVAAAIKNSVFHYTGGKLMTSKTWSRKFIALVVAVAVLSVYSMVVLAAPGAKASGELSVTGQVTVNGQKVISGGTLFSD